MNQTSKQLTKIDYLTVVFCPDEIARLRFDAKIAFGKGDFASYKEAYNAMLCAELFDQQATKINFTEQGAADCGGCVSNQWGGKYYETSPFGFNGGFYYVKATYNF